MVNIRHKHVPRSGRIVATERILKQITARRVIELGAGDFSFDYLRSRLKCDEWLKADCSPPADIICDFNRPDLQLPLTDGSCGAVIVTEVLEHLLWPQDVLREARRVLSHDGYLVVSVPNVCSASYRFAWLLGRIPSCSACGNLPAALGPTVYESEDGQLLAGHVIDFNLSRLRRLLEYAGFSCAHVSGSGVFWHRQVLPHWLVPATLASNLIVLCRKNPSSLRGVGPTS